MNNVDEALIQLSKLVTTNTKTVSILSARNMVLSSFFDVLLPHLTTVQRVNVMRSLRRCIEDATSLTDDAPLSADYQSSLLEFTNTILASLSRDSTAQR
jgi:hypothetical protein